MNADLGKPFTLQAPPPSSDERQRPHVEQVPGARWTVGMTIERAIAALKRELAAGQESKHSI
jgi:hypothetical protein